MLPGRSCCCVMLLLLYTKQVPRTSKGVCWNTTKDKAGFLFDMRVQGSFSLLRTTHLSDNFGKIHGNTHCFVLLSMTAHEITSWQWVTVPYFPVPYVVDKMGEAVWKHTDSFHPNLLSRLRAKYHKHQPLMERQTYE